MHRSSSLSSAIRRAAVLGAGTMGTGIAALLAGVGIPTYLLDVVPRELTEEERQKGLTHDDPAVRNRLATQGVARALRARPALFYDAADAELITPGNVEDHLDWLGRADWIVEAVFERLDVKRETFRKIDRHRAPGAIVSSNTSGIPLRQITEGLSSDLRRHVLITHFFNPVRYMKLLEIVPGEETDPRIVASMTDFAEHRLGKGVVRAKDTPNFIANRIGTFGMCALLHYMIEGGYRVEEVDQIFGPALGRPKSAVFRTADLVGVDVLADVARNVYESLPDDPQRRVYKLPDFIGQMVQRGWLGRKSGQGFYKRVTRNGKTEYWALDYRTMDYRPQEKGDFPSLKAAGRLKDLGERIRAVVYAEDRAGRLAWKALSAVLRYAAGLIPEVADDIYSVDRALRWGFNWELGPFETWDAIGVRRSVERMAAEGHGVPPLVEKLLRAGETFYKRRGRGRFYFDVKAADYAKLPRRPGLLRLSELKRSGRRVLKQNNSASLIDLGDGVACLEFHSYMNAIDQETIALMNEAVEAVEGEARLQGLVIANEGENFSVGANVMLVLGAAQSGDWQGLERAVKAFQDANMALKYADKPVVVAPHAMALGGGAEIVMHGAKVRAAAETYMGLVEFGVGLIPAGGGCKELWLRHVEGLPQDADVDLFPLLQRAFETIGLAKVATSAKEARRLGFLRAGDGITLDRDRLLHDAKAEVLALVQTGYAPPPPKEVPVTGRAGYAALLTGIQNFRWANRITEHEQLMAQKLARVLTGGDVAQGAKVGEQHLLDLEREAFLSLCGTAKTQERIQHFLATGKPLRN